MWRRGGAGNVLILFDPDFQIRIKKVDVKYFVAPNNDPEYRMLKPETCVLGKTQRKLKRE
jgi:hypothetical protein